MDEISRDTLISASENRTMFDKIAKTYDKANRLISLGMDSGWRKKTIKKLSPNHNGNYLDIGTGTGDLAFELLSQVPKAQVYAIDPSENMLSVAREKSLSIGVSRRPRFQNADALNLPMPDSFFDGIVSGFCFRNIEDRQKALHEMYRVVKPNGKVLILEATYPSNIFIRVGYKIYTPFVPKIGKLFGDDGPYAYLLDSIEDFPRQEKVIEMFKIAKFQNIKSTKLALGTVSIFEGRKI
ncbi:MAG: bifunctional demethylmenaquinone methyltransferase/2-methoxy-6-polyprenyl-1,4-benzoquinol methylase UbiE [Pontiellaceae bacterium]